jgi:hypothetical protein
MGMAISRCRYWEAAMIFSRVFEQASFMRSGSCPLLGGE